MKLSDNEKRNIINMIQAGKNLPEKYRFLLFEDSREIELKWNGKSNEITNIALPSFSSTHSRIHWWAHVTYLICVPVIHIFVENSKLIA